MPLVRHVLRRHELPSIPSNKDVAVCDACQQGKSHQLPFSESSRVVKHPLGDDLATADRRRAAVTCVPPPSPCLHHHTAPPTLFHDSNILQRGASPR